jgi:CRISPR-associated protein Cst1
MKRFCFTGNPFVDAGIAGMCAASGVKSFAELDEEAVKTAKDNLLRVMTSNSMFQKRMIGKKETALATSEMTIIFPNGPLSQASYSTVDRKRDEYKKRVQRKYEAFQQSLAGQTEDIGFGTCFVDGSVAYGRVGNDEFPLVDSKSKRNFHPDLQGGHAVGAFTALALEFFPFSILRTGINSGFFWFVHTAYEKIAIACAEMTLQTMNDQIARAEGIGFFGDWEIPSRDKDAALVALIRDIVAGRKQDAISSKEIEKSGLPVTAYDFSNDNRGPQIIAHDLPHSLFLFFDELRHRGQSLGRFNREVLQSDYGWLAAKRMLAREPIISVCLTKPTEGKSGRLRGGWEAHSLYAVEVLKLSNQFIRDVEAVSGRIVESEKVKDWILMLQKKDTNVGAALLRLNRASLMTFDEYTRLIPAEDRRAAFTARDYLLAGIYERQYAMAHDQDFVPWSGLGEEEVPEKHPIVLLAERVGKKIVATPDLGKRVATGLAQSNRLSDLRGTLLRTVRTGEVSWIDFVSIFPPEDKNTSYLVRDYLLAYLYGVLNDPDLPEPEVADEAQKIN